MGENNRTISEEVIKQVNNLTLSPEERARKVMGMLAGLDIDYWSLAWFSATYLAGLVQTFPYLKRPILEIEQLMYNHHYLFPEQLNLFDEKFGGKGGIQQEQESDLSGKGTA